MSLAGRWIFSVALILVMRTAVGAEPAVDSTLQKIPLERGIVALLVGTETEAGFPIALAKESELWLYVQAASDEKADSIRSAADAAGLLGSRIFVSAGPLTTLSLADNIADCVIVTPSATEEIVEEEVLRALRPQGTAWIGDRTISKPIPPGIDDWTHPYHGPDNNPQSNDQLVKGEFQTQFLGYPMFSPMPEQSVIAGGRIYKAMGHIAHKANQNEMLNTLLCINAYNGTILWRRESPPGFMIHRNTMIATDDALYMGDHESCKVIDGRTGQVRDEIKIPAEITDGPVWKWMAIQDGVLYALVGNPEVSVETLPSARRGLGHWPWGMWKGHDYKDPRTAFGYGRTLVAIDLESEDKQILWHHRDDEFLDARAICMNDGQIFCYSPERFLLSVDARDGRTLWRNSDTDLLTAVDANARAQHYITGYATTCYMKCDNRYIFFAGPQRNRMVVASAADGKLAWTHPTGNLQLVLREDAVWAAGPQDSENGVRLDYDTGEILDTFPARRACTRATGCVDSIFFRANGGTVRVLTETNTAQHIDPMRPPCQDGVLIANGQLFWGPWMCGCQLSLYGNIALSPRGKERPNANEVYRSALTVGEAITEVESLGAHPNDWTSYRGGNARDDVAKVRVPAETRREWSQQVTAGELPTAPVVAGKMVFVGDRSGAVRAYDEAGTLCWQQYTAGPIYFPPAVALDRVFAGSADGRVYAWEARTGRFLWSFRVAPAERWIPVYSRLISAWPVAGGVLVEGDTVYAAAGIAHYDDTYVVALDAATGELKTSNVSSGVLESEVNNGISLQGNLTVVDGELRFLAGGVYETARYDLETLRCLNEPLKQVRSQFRTAFYPYYPSYGKYVSLEHLRSDGSALTYDASYEGSLFTNLALEKPLPPGTEKPRKEAARWMPRRRGKPPETVWRDQDNLRFTSFVVSEQRILAAGHPDSNHQETFIAAFDTQDGTLVWKHELSAVPVKGGVAIDHQGRIYATLEDGQLVCFAPK